MAYGRQREVASENEEDRKSGLTCLITAKADGDTQISPQARANVLMICLDYLPDRPENEIGDVLKVPKRALADGIFS